MTHFEPVAVDNGDDGVDLTDGGDHGHGAPHPPDHVLVG